MATSDPSPHSENARLAALVCWPREHARVILAILWVFTLALPPVVVFELPVEVQAVIAVYLAAVLLNLAIVWRIHDGRKRD